MKVATLKGLKILGQAPNLKILVKIDGQVAFKSNQLTKPNRHYIDLSNSVLGRGFSKLIPVNSKGLKEVRVSQFNKRVSRVVFELVDNARPGFKTRVTSAGLEVELIYSQFTKQSKRTASKKNSETGLGMKLTDKIKRIPMIVLDPGHGGKDDGAHGGSGLLEKHLNLEISKRVKKILEVRYGFKVALTRSDDTSIPLEKRGDIANDLDAELFVSIHVNAAMRKGAKGIETYFLGRGLSERARQTAARENGEVIFSVPNNDVQRILMDMEANRKMNNSSCLARKVQDRLAKKEIRCIDEIDSNGHDLYWFLVSDVKAKLTKNKRPYLLVTATGLDGKNFRMFCWGWDGETDLPLYSLCVAEVKKNDFGYQTSMRKIKLLRI